MKLPILRMFSGIVNGRLYICSVGNPLRSIRSYLKYQLSAANSKGHGMHSPFVFRFITDVLNDRTAYPAYERIEQLRRRLKSDHRLLNIDDMGAGSTLTTSKTRSVSSIARHAAKPSKYGQLLFRMVRYYRPSTVIELGTSLGITSCYLASASEEVQVTTLEGAPILAAEAIKNIDSLGLKNIRLIEGNFDHTLQPLLDQSGSPGLVFIDGNHREEPTLRYFEQLLKKATNDTILVFDDIHWSEEMERAWEQIKNHPATRCTVDLFFIGIVWLRQEFKEKQHFTIRF